MNKEESDTVNKNKMLMKTLGDAWNSQDWKVFRERHTEDAAVYWPGQPEPTKGGDPHQKEAEEFFKTFPDNHIENDPYNVLMGQDDWTSYIRRHDERTYEMR